jgi:hypothetical protein
VRYIDRNWVELPWQALPPLVLVRG